VLNQENYRGLLKTSLRHLVDAGDFAGHWLRRLPAADHHPVCNGWRMSEEAQAEHIAGISEKMKRAFYEIGEGETPGDAIFSATMALSLFIYELTSQGAEITLAQRSAELLVDAVTQMTKEDLN